MLMTTRSAEAQYSAHLLLTQGSEVVESQLMPRLPEFVNAEVHDVMSGVTRRQRHCACLAWHVLRTGGFAYHRQRR